MIKLSNRGLPWKRLWNSQQLRLINAENEIGSTMALENFILGFRLGVRMILEALDEDDGSLLDPNKEG